MLSIVKEFKTPKGEILYQLSNGFWYSNKEVLMMIQTYNKEVLRMIQTYTYNK
jgi:hypothetical protein